MPRTHARPASGLDLDAFETLDFSAACAEFEGLEPHVQEYPEATSARVYRGDLVAAEIDWGGDDSGENLVIVVDGDLWCDGLVQLFADQDDETAFLLYVRGRISARDLAARNDAAVVASGDIEAERILLCGGANLGHIVGAGRISAQLVLEWTDGQIRAASGDPQLWAGQPHNVRIPDARTIAPADVLVAEALDEDGRPDQKKIVTMLRKDQSPLR